MVVDTRYLVGLVVHEGQVDGQHRQQAINAFPGRSFANLVGLGPAGGWMLARPTVPATWRPEAGTSAPTQAITPPGKGDVGSSLASRTVFRGRRPRLNRGLRAGAGRCGDPGNACHRLRATTWAAWSGPGLALLGRVILASQWRSLARLAAIVHDEFPPRRWARTVVEQRGPCHDRPTTYAPSPPDARPSPTAACASPALSRSGWGGRAGGGRCWRRCYRCPGGWPAGGWTGGGSTPADRGLGGEAVACP
jgi:hypothetical protein